jgi:hypothetical protein
MTGTLVKYEAARKALAAAHGVDEVKDIRDKAVAMQEYAKQAKDSQLIEYATEIKLRAERKAGQLLAQMAERGERRSAGEHSGNQYSERFPSETIPPKLENLGVTKIQSHRWQKLADLDDEVFEATVEAAKTKMVAAVEGRGTAFRTTFTGYQNWFAPPQYLELAREVLGDFDLDPASHIEAQKVIQAKNSLPRKTMASLRNGTGACG